MEAYHDETLSRGGLTFTVQHVHDQDSGPPWEEHDGHGPVTDWTDRPKLPGERLLIEDRGSRRYYDFKAATTIAKRDGWNLCKTRAEAAVAAEQDYEFLRGWCNDDWRWCGVVVCVEGTDHRASLWGIESNAGTYLDEVAKELADELIAGLPAYLARESARLDGLREAVQS